MSLRSFAATDPALDAYQYAQAFVSELAAHGVRHACICPGSRSTPLTLAFAHAPQLRTWEHIDERSAAFFAMGMAKALREPVAVVCTSGTAAANFMPAVVESRYSQAPLLVLTADRPHELRDTGALQSIDQVKLYGSHVKWFVDMAIAGDGFNGETYARSIAHRAASACLSAPMGPVHINFPFREPLVPVDQEPSETPAPRFEPMPEISRRARLSSEDIRRLAGMFNSFERGVIVCGPQDDPEFPDSIIDMAIALGYPVLADPLSQLRTGSHDLRTIIDNYDAFLRHDTTALALRPDVVIRFGLTPTSKPLLAYLGRHEHVRQLMVAAGGGWQDPLRTAGTLIDADPALFAMDIATVVRSPESQAAEAIRPAEKSAASERTGAWLDLWRATSTCARLVVAAELAADSALSEPKVFERLAEKLPSNALLYVGNSMPIRDLDDFFSARERPVRTMGNRGVNGIDGVISSALGASAALQSRVVLVIGDLSFYHDMNGLLAAKLHRLDATIILLNNNGGGIFSFLPQAGHPETFERYFATPTNLDFRPAVAMYGGQYFCPDTWDEFDRSIATSFEEPGLSVIEVRSDRRDNARRHGQIWDSVKEALDRRTLDPPV